MSNIGQPASPLPPRSAPGTASLELLALALRARPSTVDELAAMTRDEPSELRERLQQLAEFELIALNGEHIGYRPPAQTITALGTGMLDRLNGEVNARLDETRSLLATLPSLIASAVAGAASHAELGGEVFHGPTAAHELWRSLILQQRERSSACMFPEAEALFIDGTAISRAWRSALDESEMSVRAIISTADLARPESRAMLDVAASRGVEFRAMRRPPSWFWLTERAVGLPLRWGDPWPTSAVALQGEAVVSLMHGLYDVWWTAATPLHPTEHPWDGVVALMADGATLETAAHALGISARTGRRRIEAAMDHYGTTGAVALGAAWQRERELSSG